MNSSISRAPHSCFNRSFVGGINSGHSLRQVADLSPSDPV